LLLHYSAAADIILIELIVKCSVNLNTTAQLKFVMISKPKAAYINVFNSVQEKLQASFYAISVKISSKSRILSPDQTLLQLKVWQQKAL
jgi:hypothetical protein